MARSEPNQTEYTWSPKKEQAALALAEGKTWTQVLESVGIARGTLALWCKQPEFKARVEEHIAEVVDEARRILRRNAAKAAQQIVNIAEYGSLQHGVRLQGSKDILDRVGLKAPEKLDIVADVNVKGYMLVSPDDWDEPTPDA